MTWRPIHTAQTEVFRRVANCSRPLWVRNGAQRAVATLRHDTFETREDGRTLYTSAGWQDVHTGERLAFAPREWAD